MIFRSSTGGAIMVQRRRTSLSASPTRRSAPRNSRKQHSTDVEPSVAVLSRERDEALVQQRAIEEVLRIISASPAELQTVLEVVARSAARFCEADDVTIFELDGQDLRLASHWGSVAQDRDVRFPCTRGSVTGRAVLERKPFHVTDLQGEVKESPEGSAFARRMGHRTIAAAPLLHEGVAVGAITLRRTEVNPFTDKQIALLGTFAAQAVIAIENARLLNELRQRTDDLSESLEQQTATSEVLGVISSSPGDLEPVFEALLANAVRLCDAYFGNLFLYDGASFQTAAMRNAPKAYVDYQRERGSFKPPPGTSLDRIVETKDVVHILDDAAEAAP